MVGSTGVYGVIGRRAIVPRAAKESSTSSSTGHGSVKRCAAREFLLVTPSAISRHGPLTGLTGNVAKCVHAHDTTSSTIIGMSLAAHEETRGAREEDVIEPKVPHTSKRGTESDKGTCGADETADGHVPPVMKAVHDHCECDEHCGEDGGEEEEDFPIGWVVCG